MHPKQKRDRLKQLAASSEPLTDDELGEVEEFSRDGASELVRGATLLRHAVYVMLKRDGLATLKMTKEEYFAELCSYSRDGRHRSTINRQVLAADGDYRLGLPPGELPEFSHRTLRIWVLEEDQGRVLKQARREKGSYREIGSSDIKKIAKKLRCLKQRSAGKAEAERSQRASDGDECSKSALASEGIPARRQTIQAKRMEKTSRKQLPPLVVAPPRPRNGSGGF